MTAEGITRDRNSVATAWLRERSYNNVGLITVANAANGPTVAFHVDLDAVYRLRCTLLAYYKIQFSLPTFDTCAVYA